MAFPSGTKQSISGEIPPLECKAPQIQQRVDSSHNAACSRQRSGYDCEFVQTPQELQKDCPICLFVLCEPFQVTCCGYSFCRACIEYILSNKKACPTCNEATFSAFPNKGLQRALYSFRVRCTHHKNGCEWTGELRELDGHLNPKQQSVNKKLVGCEFAAVVCTHCCEYFQRRYVQTQKSESCPQRPFSCDYCKDYRSVYEDVVNSHWPMCKCYPVPCPNECGVSSERQNVEAHVNTACPLTVVNCDFHYTGCEVKLIRKDMPTHLTESLATHIILLTNQTRMLEGKNGQESVHPHMSLLALHNLQLTQLTLQLKKSLEESQYKIRELEKEMQAQATINAKLQQSCEASEHKIEALTLKVAEDELRGKQKHSLVETHHKFQELEREKHAIKCEIEIRERQRDEDRASLAALRQLPAKFIMTNFEEIRAKNELWYSPPFYVQGYKLCLRVDANGYRSEYISVFAFLMRGEFDEHLKWPFQGHVTVAMLNQLEDKNHTSHTMRFTEAISNSVIGRVTDGEMASSGWGCQNFFIAHTDLNYKPAKNCQYLKDGCLHFRIVRVELR